MGVHDEKGVWHTVLSANKDYRGMRILVSSQASTVHGFCYRVEGLGLRSLVRLSLLQLEMKC